MPKKVLALDSERVSKLEKEIASAQDEIAARDGMVLCVDLAEQYLSLAKLYLLMRDTRASKKYLGEAEEHLQHYMGKVRDHPRCKYGLPIPGRVVSMSIPQ